MQLHHLTKTTKKSQRIGRGGKRGSFSGRGVKGQRSRSGHRIRPAERDLILRFPKKRGFRNKPKTEKCKRFNLEDLIKKLKIGPPEAQLNRKFLSKNGFIPKSFKGGVKILGDGTINFPLRVEGLSVSKSAKAKIEKAGGSVNE